MCQETPTQGFCMCVIGNSFICLRMAQMKVTETSACGPFGTFDESASGRGGVWGWQVGRPPQAPLFR